MRYQIDVHDYDKCIRLKWDDGHRIWAVPCGDAVRLVANREGLITMARHLLTLAQDSVPDGSHVHLDSGNGLEDGSLELILEKGHPSQF